MTIKEFIDKWSPPDEPRLRTIFLQDFWSLMDKLGDDRFRQVAIEVLGDINGCELKIYDTNRPGGYVDGTIGWGRKGEVESHGYLISYSKAVGQQGGDWLQLLKLIVANAIPK